MTTDAAIYEVALAEWGLRPDELDEIPTAFLSEMLQVAVQRKQWESRVLAAEMLKMIGGAMGKVRGGAIQQVSPGEMMRQFGVEIH